MKTILGSGLIALALLAGCESAKPRTVGPINTPNANPANDPFNQPFAVTPAPTPSPVIPSDMGGTGPFIPDTTARTPAPRPRTVSATKPPAPKPAAHATAKTYTVKKGDTLSGIAKAMYGNGKLYNKIVKANPGLDPNKIKVGQKLNIPA